jgi:hypothetical protein
MQYNEINKVVDEGDGVDLCFLPGGTRTDGEEALF